MGHFSLRGVLRILAASVLAILCGCAALAQSLAPVTENAATSAKADSDLLNKLDQLVEKNQQLEKQNEELVDQINELRQFLAQQTSVSPTSSKGGSTTSANSVVAPPNAANKQTAQGSGQVSTPTQDDNDDKTLLPEGSS